MKTFGKSKELKGEEETMSIKPQALSDDELEQIIGGAMKRTSKCKLTGQRLCVGHHDECGSCYGLL